MMSRLNLTLAVLLLLSCFWLIRSSNEARGLFVALERAQVREKELAVDYDRLKVERRTAATPLVVEDMVRNRLNMFNAGPDVTHYVNGAQAGVVMDATTSRPVVPESTASQASAGGEP
ncbi:MAG TPA: cell division protein FtsL [Aquabacterium sp.]|uniref:cell division protein FtsL n=1 Tax=Aquabacterium sp. TaxID=1872578 RepID=UPI002E31A82C|nr:cell division protein FtsL [Aquabacterium sp.]HEX5372805.1 cell division protein FtsL [Aquabacterium sp.]